MANPYRSTTTLPVTIEVLTVLADIALRDNTLPAFVPVALQWAREANDEINRLRTLLAEKNPPP